MEPQRPNSSLDPLASLDVHIMVAPFTSSWPLIPALNKIGRHVGDNFEQYDMSFIKKINDESSKVCIHCTIVGYVKYIKCHIGYIFRNESCLSKKLNDRFRCVRMMALIEFHQSWIPSSLAFGASNWFAFVTLLRHRISRHIRHAYLCIYFLHLEKKRVKNMTGIFYKYFQVFKRFLNLNFFTTNWHF